jgi:hypothetical protein
MTDETIGELGKELVYDLRQVYGVELVGEHLKDIARARKSDNYLMYFKCLKDLFILIRHKLKKPEDKEKKFNDLIKTAADIANEYNQDWTGQNKTPEGVAAIEQALNKIEVFLYSEMEDAKMFGANKQIQGL